MDRIIPDLLNGAAKKFPEREALSDEHKSYTFSAFREAACRIATKLASNGVFRKPIAVCMDKEADEIVSFMGCVYSGNFYAPIDPEMPIHRIRMIFESLLPACIVTNEKYLHLFSDMADTLTVFTIEKLLTVEINEQLIKRCNRRIIDTDPAYVLFTSGSTGTPKGVLVSHRSAISYADWVVRTFDIDETVVLGNQTPFYFSMSVLDIYAMLTTGCKMVIIPKRLFSAPGKLLDYVLNNNVNMIYWVPSAMNLVANSGKLDEFDMSSLKKVLFAGEVMPNRQLNIWRRSLPNTLFANLFGPTEVTDICTYYIVEREFRDDEPLPIGFPCVNTDILLLNDANELIPEDDIEHMGELCVRGIQLAYGYYNNEEKTKAAFVQNPLNRAYPEFIYRTGDLAKYNEYGEIMYMGRKDFQIKVSGYRIELGEIETAVSAVEEIESNCCLFDAEEQLILCIFTGEIEKKNLRAKIKEKLPRYMMPHKYIHLDEMPLNANGKIDRVALKKKYIEKER